MDNPPPSYLDSDPTSSSSTTTTTTTTTTTNGNNPNNGNGNDNNRDQFLRHLTHLNKLSHKISKPSNRPSEPPVHSSPVHPPQQQPPVYNISKSDFRSVVQKLTGSPSHAPCSTPPTLHAPKPNSSRLQRIRPPPLAQLSTNPPSSLTCARNTPGFGFGPGLGPVSPLPPLPMCQASAESPISAYMRFIHSAVNNNHGGIMFPTPDNYENVPPPQTQFAAADTLPFRLLTSPKSPCQIVSPKLLLPLSPTVPSVPSPK